jgi:hypothetical protein
MPVHSHEPGCPHPEGRLEPRSCGSLPKGRCKSCRAITEGPRSATTLTRPDTTACSGGNDAQTVYPVRHRCGMSRSKRKDGETDEQYTARIESAREADRRSYARNAENYARRARERRAADPQGHRESSRAWSKKNRDHINEGRRRKLDPPAGHPGTCEVCGILPEVRADGRRGLNQDHRHDNNLIRGWLCHRCNILMCAIDLRFNDPELFAKLMSYSRRGEPVEPVRSGNPLRRRRQFPSPDQE